MDDVAAWPIKSEKYLPIESAEFQELITKVNRAAESVASHAVITAASYVGRLRSDGIVAGRGTWTVQLRGDEPEVLRLGDHSLTIRGARWRDEPQRPMRLGQWGARGAPASDPGLEVSHSGTVEFDWQIVMQPARSGNATLWRFPQTSSSRLSLDLPAGFEPTVEGGVLFRPAALGSNASAERGRHNWEIALGPSPRAALGITTADNSLAEPVTDVSLREYAVYRIDQRGVEIEVTLSVDDPAARLRELVVPLPADVQFMAAELDGKELAWRVTKRDPAGGTSAVIALPEATSQRGLSVRIRAWHPLVLHRDWQLPQLRPNGVFWTAGEIELSVAPMLELQQLAPTDCLQTGVIPSTSDSTGSETCWLTAYSPAAGAKVSVAPRSAVFSLRQGTSLSLVEPILNGRLISEMHVSRGNIHVVSGDVASGWSVAGVETDPSNALGEWFLNRDDHGTQLEIQLAQAASPNRSVTVIVTAQRQRPSPEEELPTDVLRMVRWHGAERTEQLLAFQTVEPCAAEPIGGLPRATPNQIAGAASTLLGSVGRQATIFDLAGAPDGSALHLVPKRGAYDVRASLEARIDHNKVQASYRLEIVPQKSSMDHVLVYCNVPLGDAVGWKDEATGRQLVAVRLASSNPLRGNLPAGGDAWLVRLLQPTTREFALVATLTTPILERVQVPLLCVPDAAHQEGRVLVRGTQSNGPTLEIEGLQPVPLPMGESSTDSSAIPPILAAYRYEPARCQDTALSPRVWIDSGDVDVRVRPLARQALLESVFSADGRSVHRARFQLEGRGLRQLSYHPPHGAVRVAVSLDGHALKLPAAAAATEAISIRLPETGQPATLEIQFEAKQSPLRSGSELRPPLLEDVQILDGEWSIRLPAEFELLGDNQLMPSEDFSLRWRLFGPLGRSVDNAVFHPLRASDWVELASRVSGTIRLQADSAAEPTAVSRPPEPNSPTAAVQTRNGNVASESQVTASAGTGSRAGVAQEIDDRDNLDHTGSRTKPRNQDVLAGWREYRTSFVAAGPPPLTVAHSPSTTTWSISAFLLCFVSGGWLAGRHREVYVMCVAGAAIAAILLPAAWAPVATGAFLGLLFTLMAMRPRAAVTDETPTKTWNRATDLGVAVWLVIVGIAGPTVAQSPTGDKRQVARDAVTAEKESGNDLAKPLQPAAIHSVLIPTDVSGRPAGTRWYVDEHLLRELYESAQSGEMHGRDWLLRDIACDGELRDRDEGSGIVAGEWKLTLVVDVMVRETTIALPLVRGEASWAATASLDGIPSAILWKNEGRGCEIQVIEPGTYDVAISFVPRIDVAGDRQKIGLTLPEVPGGRAQVRYPVTLTGVEVKGAVPLSQPGSTPGSLAQELDGSGRLSVAWPRADSTQNETQGLRVNELYWLRIEGDDIWLDAKYVVEGGARRPEVLSVAYDPQWQLVSPDGAISIDSAETGTRRLARVTLPPDDIDRQEVTVHWRLAQAMLLGNLRLPPIALASLPVTQRWFAIASSTALKCDVLDAGDILSGTPEEFLARWGEPATDYLQPIVARLEPNVMPAVSVRPRKSEPAIVESLQIAAGNNGLRVQYRCDVTENGLDLFQLPLSVSEEIHIDEVIVTRSGQRIPVRWSRPTANSMQVFFGQGLADTFQLTVHGHVQRNNAASYAVPRITATDASTQRVQLYREDHILLNMQGLSTSAGPESQAFESPPSQWQVHRAGFYLIAPQSYSSARLVVVPNHVQTAGRSLTMLEREADNWWATYACQLTIEQGELSILRLRAPSNWVGPLELQSDLPASVDLTPLEHSQSVVSVRFSEPVRAGQSLGLRLRGRILGDEATSVVVPQIDSETAIRGPRYALVPSQIDGRPAAWDELGVRPTLLPPELTALVSETEPQKCFEITATPFQVALRSSEIKGPTTMVLLADTRAEVGPFGGQLIVTQMVVLAPELTEITLELPVGQDLVTATRDDKPALVRRLDDRRWRLLLGPARLPQVVQTVCTFRGNDEAEQRLEISRPRLLANGRPVSVEVGLWSLGLPGRSDKWSIERAAVVTAAEQAALRLERLLNIVEAATPAAVDLPVSEGRDWYLPWAARLESVRRYAFLTLGQPADLGSVLQVSASADELLVQASEQLDIWIEQGNEIFAAADSPAAKLSIGETVAAPWEMIARKTANERFYCVADGDSAGILVSLANRPAVSKWSRIPDLLFVLSAAAAAIAILRRPSAYDFLSRWPHAAAFLIGIASWAWLWPSWIGLLIAGACLWLALRRGWPGGSLRADGSTFVRTEHSA